MTARERIEKAMDEFILAIGGNLDRRAANNRDRKALRDFYEEVYWACAWPEDVVGHMNLIIDQKPVFTCEKEYRVYDHLMNVTDIVKLPPKE